MSVGLTIFRTEFVGAGLFVICLHTKCHTTYLDGSYRITISGKEKYEIHLELRCSTLNKIIVLAEVAHI
jgi:hypothetical protein